MRFFIIETHYRSPLDFSDERLKESQTSLNRLNTAMENVYELAKQKPGQVSAASKALVEAALQAKKDFYEAMDDDFNTALALSYMFALAKEINIYYHAVTTGEIEHAVEDFAQAKAVYEDMADILGILVADGSKITEEDTGMVEDLMKLIIELRQQARASKDWATADKIRDDLKAIGVTLEDSPTGIRWKK